MKISLLDRYILKSYLTILVSFFFILMFIFIIQTVWVFIDEFAGKGIDIGVLLRFLLYYSPKLIPLVWPALVGVTLKAIAALLDSVIFAA